ncbi:MAG: hypothetical protein ACRDTH_08365 [Pseudonocardiaceae bacterium]
MNLVAPRSGLSPGMACYRPSRPGWPTVLSDPRSVASTQRPRLGWPELVKTLAVPCPPVTLVAGQWRYHPRSGATTIE